MFQSTVLVTVLSITFHLAGCSPAPPFPAKIYDVNRSMAAEVQAPNLNPGRTQNAAQRQAAALINAHEAIQAHHNARQASTLARLQADALARAHQPPIAGHLVFTNGRTVSRADRQASAIVNPQVSLRSYHNAQRLLDPARGPKKANVKDGELVYTVRVNSAASQPLQVQRALAERYIAQHRKKVIDKANKASSSRQAVQAGLQSVPPRSSSAESVGENLYQPEARRARYRGEATPFINRRPAVQVEESETSAFTKYPTKRLPEDDFPLELRTKFPRLTETAGSSSGKPSSTTHVPFPMDRWSTKNLLAKMPITSTPDRAHITPINDVDTSLTLKRPDDLIASDVKSHVDTNFTL